MCLKCKSETGWCVLNLFITVRYLNWVLFFKILRCRSTLWTCWESSEDKKHQKTTVMYHWVFRCVSACRESNQRDFQCVLKLHNLACTERFVLLVRRENAEVHKLIRMVVHYELQNCMVELAGYRQKSSSYWFKVSEWNLMEFRMWKTVWLSK